MFTRRAFLRSTLAGAAGTLVPTAASRAQGSAPGARRGGTLAAAIFADPLSFDPHLAGNLQGRAACRAIHDTLLTVDANGMLAPGLVESWERPDDRTRAAIRDRLFDEWLRQRVRQAHVETPLLDVV